jgi:hypothetical protein
MKEQCDPPKIPTSGHARDYQIRACGATEYYVRGNGQQKCADAVEGDTVVDCKSLVSPKSSPQLGTSPQFITQKYIADARDDLMKYQNIISDPQSKCKKLVIRVEDQQQVSFWRNLLAPLTIATDVEVMP